MELELHQLDLRYAPLRRRCPQRERALLGSLAEHGQQVPVVVVAGETQHVLVDGYKRVRALARLGRDTVRATLWPLEEPEALLLERLMRRSETESALEQGWLLRELHERFGLGLEELGRRFDRSPSWVSRRLALVRELPEPIQEQVRRGELGAHVAMKYLVPLACANRRETIELATALSGRGLSSRQLGTLCATWASGTASTRQLVIEQPLLVLDAQAESQRPAPEPNPAERLRSDLGALAAIARRARRLLREPGAGAWVAAARADLGRLALATEQELERLMQLCRKEFVDARPEHAHGDPEAA
jgi:ParB family chromosome partitioning protein